MTQAPALSVGLVCEPTASAVAELETGGVDSLWVGGHVASPNPTPEAMVQLARLAAVSERVRIGTSILLLPLYAPAIVAKQVADIDNVTGGRVTLGVGVGGEYEGEFRACQIPLAERGSRTDEAIGVLRALWTGEEQTLSGPHFPMESVRIHPAPRQPGGPPIVVAGRQPVAMRRAATLGDGWMPYLFSARRYAESVSQIEGFAAAAGRDLAGFEWCAFVFVNAAADRQEARQGAATFLGGNYRQDFDAMLDRVAVAGAVDDVVAGLQAYVEA
ncbi:MAG: TIGR03619 family F420-dependent LLM class oxidoreductase, partial [Ilumatobacteraceae bacterium]